METCYMTSMRGSTCFCVKCKQGILTKAQYTDQIRALCLQSQAPRANRDISVSAKRHSTRKTNTSMDGRSEHNFKLLETVVSKNELHDSIYDHRYYVDEEQPTDLYSYNLMVNGRLADPRILPAVVDAIKYLRNLYHQILMQTKCISSSVFDERSNNFGSKGSDSYSSDDLSSGEFTVNKPQSFEQKSLSANRLVDKNARATNQYTNGTPHGKLQKRRVPVEGSKEQSEADGRDSDSGIHFDCDSFESRNTRNTRLHEAAKNGDVEKVIQLILDCCDVNGLNRDGWPAVESALNSSKFRAALFLIEAGTDIKSYTEKKVNEYEGAMRRVRNYTHFIRTAV